MTPPQIRRLAPDDAAEYRELMLRAYVEEAEAFTATPAEREPLPLSFWESRVSDRPDAAEMVLGAFAGGRLGGVAGLRFEQRPRTCHKALLYGMFVSAELRGRGVARALVEAALEAARSRPGTQVVQLTVVEANAAARRLYESCGFRPFGTEPFANRIDRRYLSLVHMWCPVGPDAG